MKRKYLILLGAAILTVVLYSFKTIALGEQIENDKIVSLEEHKKGTKILVDYYAQVLQNQFDKAYAESENGEIDEQKIVSSLALVTEYGCAYEEDNCTGHKVCGVTLLYAETFGYESWSGSETQACEDTDPYIGGPQP